uniref:CRC domain-containing protein n=1 Tax=Kalanchoe fedtschenkoi TaxID=63787 RepID=A0A7N0TEP6_KALFE
MDTPERNQIGSSLSKHEDSPVFNYLSNLSPIKPMKSAPITQTFTTLNFSSLPSIFTSPHVSSHKESRFLLRRHNTPDKSQSEFSSYIDVSSNKENDVFVDVNQLHNCSSELQKVSDTLDSVGRAPLEPLHEESDLSIDLSHNLKNDCGSPDSEGKAARDEASQSAEAATSSVMLDQGPSISLPAVHETPSGWESLISDGADLLMFDSPNIAAGLKELFKSPPVEHMGSSFASQFHQDTPDFLKSDPAFLVDVGELQNETYHHAETEVIDCARDDFPSTMTGCMTSHPSENVDDESMMSLHRGVRRRCLVFDTKGAQRKSLIGASSSNPSMCMNDNKKRDASKIGGSSALCILPGIGLHLNALATSGDRGGGQVSVSSSATTFQSPATAHESVLDVFSGASSQENADSGIIQCSEDACLAPGLVSLDDINQNSPRKKRRKPESSGDESCKRCNCKKSKCLKLYCECFAAGVYCIGTCACQNCFNKPVHEDTVLATRKQIESRNPLAFAPKVIRTSDPLPDIKDEVMNTPASARHKRGCNCKKSSCLKKYCECYQGGVGCSVNCRCESCKNVFGTKDGSAPVAVATQDGDEEEETEKVEMNNKGLQSVMPHNNEEHNPNTFLATPLRLTRMSMQLPFSSKGKPPRSSFLAVDSASGLQASQKFSKPNYVNPPPKFQRNYPAGQDETEMPEMLRNNGSPISAVKTSSPNSKRVSSPHSNFGSSPAPRSTRKLILQSIPSFPSLTQPAD